MVSSFLSCSYILAAEPTIRSHHADHQNFYSGARCTLKAQRDLLHRGRVWIYHLALIYRRFGILGTTQLAFVLTSKFTLFQAKFISYPLFIFAFPVVHSGNKDILTF